MTLDHILTGQATKILGDNLAALGERQRGGILRHHTMRGAGTGTVDKFYVALL